MKSMKKDWYKKGWTSAMAKIMEIIAKETKGKSYHKQGDEIKMNIHKDKMLWYNTSYCIKVSYERS